MVVCSAACKTKPDRGQASVSESGRRDFPCTRIARDISSPPRSIIFKSMYARLVSGLLFNGIYCIMLQILFKFSVIL
jgi:hypothetical protein